MLGASVPVRGRVAGRGVLRCAHTASGEQPVLAAELPRGACCMAWAGAGAGLVCFTYVAPQNKVSGVRATSFSRQLCEGSILFLPAPSQTESLIPVCRVGTAFGRNPVSLHRDIMVPSAEQGLGQVVPDNVDRNNESIEQSNGNL